MSNDGSGAIVTFDAEGYTLDREARASMQAAADRWGWKLHTIGERLHNRAQWWYQKFKWLGDWPLDVDRVLFLDGDMLIRADCPSPPLLGDDVLGLVDASQEHKFAGHSAKMNRMAKAWCNRLGVSLPEDRIAQGQGGFRLVPRSLSGFYLLCWNTIKGLSGGEGVHRGSGFIKHDNADMGFEAAMRLREGIAVEWLPPEWDVNLPPFDKTDAWQTPNVRDGFREGQPLLPGYITHFGGGPFRKKVERMREYDWKRVTA